MRRCRDKPAAGCLTHARQAGRLGRPPCSTGSCALPRPPSAACWLTEGRRLRRAGFREATQMAASRTPAPSPDARCGADSHVSAPWHHQRGRGWQPAAVRNRIGVPEPSGIGTTTVNQGGNPGVWRSDCLRIGHRRCHRVTASEAPARCLSGQAPARDLRAGHGGRGTAGGSDREPFPSRTRIGCHRGTAGNLVAHEVAPCCLRPTLPLVSTGRLGIPQCRYV